LAQAHSFYEEPKEKTVMDIDKLRSELEADEGCKYEIYLDHLGYPTFGIGYLVTEWDEEYNKEVGTPVSEERVAECFDKTVKQCVKDCKLIYPNFDKLPGEAQLVLANMSFNLGYHRLKNFKKLQASIVDENFSLAADEMSDSKWARDDVPNRANRLIERMKVLNGSIQS